MELRPGHQQQRQHNQAPLGNGRYGGIRLNAYVPRFVTDQPRRATIRVGFVALAMLRIGRLAAVAKQPVITHVVAFRKTATASVHGDAGVGKLGIITARVKSGAPSGTELRS